ncbi:MAG: flagellar basal body P-ring formation protein FlgA [Defluviimonas sp.]|uniref:flagellar basal body P-ring formation chaperone FlgA n=1 Tax=Albidovulum sp. TaxID=1872424 RepID=UPI002A318628|nr:flagellar basal body P-ring formation protein FlgA [Defluviimonas sp.]
MGIAVTLPLGLALALTALPAAAETLVAARTLRAHSVIAAEDLSRVPETLPGGLGDPREIIGLETRVAVFQGQPLTLAVLGPRTVVARNQPVTLRYRSGGLRILAEGRALEQGGVGDIVRVINSGSRTTVSGIIAPDGKIDVALQH